MTSPTTAILDFLPDPSDATVGTIVQLQDAIKSNRISAGSQIRTRVSHLEAPSTYLAFDLEMQVSRFDLHLDVQVERVPEPDPRRSRVPVKYCLWSYQGTKAIANFNRPSPGASKLVDGLAGRSYSLDRWCDVAIAYGHQSAREPYHDLLAAMIHPTVPVPGYSSWQWILRRQVAASLLVAFSAPNCASELSGNPVIDIANGPSDWTKEAAVISLLGLARTYPAVAPAITALFDELLDASPTDGYVCYLESLLVCSILLPGQIEEKKATYAEWLRLMG